MPTRSLPLRNLHTFAVAANKQSFKLAAQELCVTPQAVSLQIKSLEGQLGFTLFERLPAAIRLTAAGEQLLAYVQRGIGLIEQGIEEVKRSELCQQLKVSVSPWFAVNWLLPRLAEFESRYPQVDVQISTSVRFPDLKQQRYDLAIQWGFGQWGKGFQQLLLSDDKLLVCAPSFLKQGKIIGTADDLKNLRLLCTELSIELWQKLFNTLGVDSLVERQVLPLDSHAGMLNAVEQGLGVALISAQEAQEGCEQGRLVAPLGNRTLAQINPSLVPGYWLVATQTSGEQQAVKSFVAWMTTALESHPRSP